MKLFALLFLIWTHAQVLAHSTFLEKFEGARPGDFAVTLQEGNYALLFIRSLTAETLLLEEVSVPKHLIDIRTTQWQQWLDKRAPGHTSWTLYEIERSSGALLECYSFSKKGWLYMSDAEQFLSKLLFLPLDEVHETERKKIGPAPASGEPDHRPLWNPPVIVGGKKMGKPEIEVLKTRWPKDDSLLSLCAIELYFSNHPFPYWLEIKSPHYSFKMRTIDSGHHLTSPIPGAMPHRSPELLGSAIKTKSHWKLPIQTPSYYASLKLYARDVTDPSATVIPLQITTEAQCLLISVEELRSKLNPSHRYRWVLVPNAAPEIAIESEELFQPTL